MLFLHTLLVVPRLLMRDLRRNSSKNFIMDAVASILIPISALLLRRSYKSESNLYLILL